MYAMYVRTNQTVLLLDSTGRSYALPAHNLPSARSQGEPISSRLNPPSGASLKGARMGADTEQAVLATDAGYGRSEEHTSELQSRGHLGCPLLFDKKMRRKAAMNS